MFLLARGLHIKHFFASKERKYICRVYHSGDLPIEICILFVISGFRRDIDEICALLGHYAAYLFYFYLFQVYVWLIILFSFVFLSVYY
jgi:hypothetical protein